jgi:hypothetical protein
MDQPPSFEWAAGKAASLWLGPQVLGSAVAVLVVLLVAVRARFGPGEWTRPLRTPAVRTDAAYAVFYAGGFYAFVVAGPAYRFLTALVERYAPQLQLHLLSHLPVYAQFLVASVTMDGVLTDPPVDAPQPVAVGLPSVHTPTGATALANSSTSARRSRPGPGRAGPAPRRPRARMAAGGLDPGRPRLPGPHGSRLGLLQPPGHGRSAPASCVHHWPSRRTNTNFGMTYSFWDRLFGTAAPGRAPSRYGVPGLAVPESHPPARVPSFLAGAVRSRDPGQT